MPFSENGRVSVHEFNQAQSNQSIEDIEIDMTGFRSVVFVVNVTTAFTANKKLVPQDSAERVNWSNANAINPVDGVDAPAVNNNVLVEVSAPNKRWARVSSNSATAGIGTVTVLLTDAYNTPPLGSEPDVAGSF